MSEKTTFINTASKTPTTTEEQGTVYLAANVPTYNNIYTLYPQNDVNASKIFHLRYNVYAAGVERKQRTLLFSEDPSIEVLGPDGEVDEEVQSKIAAMMQGVDFSSRIMQAWSDVFWYGMAIFNWVWTRQGNEVVLTALNRLPPHSFDIPKPGQSLVHSPILQGINVPTDATGKPIPGASLEFWQRTSLLSMRPEQLNSDNLFYVKDPASTELCGDPIVLPLIPVFEMLNYVWNASMQYVGRVGAPIMFMKIENPQGANNSNGMVSDVAYANTIMQNWGKDNQYVLRPNMTPIFMPSTSSAENNTLAFIDALSAMIIDYMTPSSFVSNKGDQLIGGSRQGESELFQAYVQGVHRWLESQFNHILTKYLDLNGYAGYTASISYPQRGQDKSDILMKQALTGFQTGVLDFNELRERLEADGVDDDTKALILEEQAKIRAAIGPAPAAQPLNEPVAPPAIPESEKAHTHTVTREAHPLDEDMRKAVEKLHSDVMAIVESEVSH